MVTGLAASLRDARRRAKAEAAIATGDFDDAEALLRELSLAGQTAYGALIRVRRGERVDPQTLLIGVERLPAWAADRLRLLAARVELDRGEGGATRALLTKISPQRSGAANLLLAEACVREALVAAKTMDVRAMQRGLVAASALDSKRGEAGYPRAAGVVIQAWKSGVKARPLIPLLDVLNGPDGRVPETAPVYVEATVDASHTRVAEAGLVSARTLDRALRLNPQVEFPEELLTWLAIQAEGPGAG